MVIEPSKEAEAVIARRAAMLGRSIKIYVQKSLDRIIAATAVFLRVPVLRRDGKVRASPVGTIR